MCYHFTPPTRNWMLNLSYQEHQKKCTMYDPLDNWKETSAVLCKGTMVHGSKEYFMATEGYGEKRDKGPNFTCTPCINNVAS